MSTKFWNIPILALVLSGMMAAQVPNPTQRNSSSPANDGEAAPIFRVTVVARSITAINYHHRKGSTQVAFRGTDLLPRAEGEARVDSRTGATKIDARFDKLEPASRFGPEFLTYVLWAITPEGRANNMGEVMIDGDNARVQAGTELQAFGMIVTAEPYWAVTQPSDVVVMEAVTIPGKTTGTIQQVNAKYELLERGIYVRNMAEERIRQLREAGNRLPLDLREARNAIAIAKHVGASEYAADTMKRAEIALQNAEGFYSSGRDHKRMQTLAREAVQLSEDARIITIKRLEEKRLAAERAEQERQMAEARLNAEQEAEQRRLADIQRREEEARRRAAEIESREAQERRRMADEQRRQEEERRRIAEQQQQTAEAAAQRNAAAAQRALEEQRLAEQRAAEAQTAAQRAIEEQRAAQLAQQAAEQARQAAEAERLAAENARRQAEEAMSRVEREKTELRAELRRSFESIMETRDTARGLIINMADVLFDTAKSTLRPQAREKLAKISGILISHPGLSLEIEGHTDSVGGDEYNQRLSEARATSVRDYLAAQGVSIASMVIRGFGESRPIASNDNAKGRQQNRRVEMVVSGDIIGTPAGTTQSSSIQ